MFEDHHPHPVRHLLILHGAVVQDVGDDDRLQETDDHEGQTHREIDAWIEAKKIIMIGYTCY